MCALGRARGWLSPELGDSAPPRRGQGATLTPLGGVSGGKQGNWHPGQVTLERGRERKGRGISFLLLQSMVFSWQGCTQVFEKKNIRQK